MTQPPQDDFLFGPLVKQIKAGINRETNSEKLHKLLRSRLLRFFSRHGFSEDECRDLTQDVFFRVFKNIDAYRGESPFERWVFTIAVNVFRNEIRKRHTAGREGQEDSLEEILEEYPGILGDQSGLGPSSQSDALNEILKREQQEALRRAIAKMPRQMRLCCHFRYSLDMKYRDIAVVMNISIGAVKAHLHQARERLKEDLGMDIDPGLES